MLPARFFDHNSLAGRLSRRALTKIATRRFGPLFEDGRLRMLFIIGHMRSGSTMLVHILNSNPAIVGYGETHTNYNGPGDFPYVTLKVLSAFGRRRLEGEEYVLDKVLFPRHIPDPELLATPGTRVIFLTRPPEESLASVVHTPRFKNWKAHNLSTYWTRRMAWITNAAQRLDPDTWVHVTYRDLVERPEDEFRRLERLLGLQMPLSKEYEKMWSTGRRYVGDVSETIHTGKIVRKEATPMTDEVRAVVDKAREEYERTLEVLRAAQRTTTEP